MDDYLRTVDSDSEEQGWQDQDHVETALDPHFSFDFEIRDDLKDALVSVSTLDLSCYCV